jgi:hypothetical protein
MLPQVMKMSDPTRIDSVFGTGVFAAIGSLRGDGWQGPLRTSFGVHLVRLTGRQAPVAPKLDKIRDVVLRDYIETQTKGLVEVSYQNLLSEFQIILPSPDEITEILQ